MPPTRLADRPFKHFAADFLPAITSIDPNVFDESAFGALMTEAWNEGYLQTTQDLTISSLGHGKNIPAVCFNVLEGSEIALRKRLGEVLATFAKIIVSQQPDDRLYVLSPRRAHLHFHGPIRP